MRQKEALIDYRGERQVLVVYEEGTCPEEDYKNFKSELHRKLAKDAYFGQMLASFYPVIELYDIYFDAFVEVSGSTKLTNGLKMSMRFAPLDTPPIEDRTTAGQVKSN
jgi:hypothetical protein